MLKMLDVEKDRAPLQKIKKILFYPGKISPIQ